MVKDVRAEGKALALFDKEGIQEGVIGGADEGQGEGAEVKLEEAAAQRAEVEIVPFHRRIGDKIDLRIGEAEGAVDLHHGGGEGGGVGKINLGQALLDDGGLEG
jgi:hypothetical protein